MRQLIVRPLKIVEDHNIINLVVAPPFTLVFIKCLTFVHFPDVTSSAPGTLKRQIIEKKDVSLTWIACYSLSQLKLLSVALELMLSLLILMSRLQMYFLLITFKYILMYITKGYAENFLYLRKLLRKSTRFSWCSCRYAMPFDIWTPRQA